VGCRKAFPENLNDGQGQYDIPNSVRPNDKNAAILMFQILQIPNFSLQYTLNGNELQ